MTATLLQSCFVVDILACAHDPPGVQGQHGLHSALPEKSGAGGREGAEEMALQFRSTELSSQHPCKGTQSYLSEAPGNVMPSSTLIPVHKLSTDTKGRHGSVVHWMQHKVCMSLIPRTEKAEWCSPLAEACWDNGPQGKVKLSIHLYSQQEEYIRFKVRS